MNVFKMKSQIFTLVLSLSLSCVFSQERLSGLETNPAVQGATKKLKSTSAIQQATVLPFLDDFSKPENKLPDATKWTDRFVFINDDYAVNPLTIGVATFDAIDNTGKLYLNASPFPFGADSLTSIEIRLDSVYTPGARKITRADSLYFSFFYQPQGYGNVPANNDSLILEFLAPDENIVVIIPADTIPTSDSFEIIPADTTIIEGWVKVWGAGGNSLQNFRNLNNKWFSQVLIPVSDSSRFYKPNFRFRFRNFASLATSSLPDWQSNGDHWNIDYVYLNTGRSVYDTAHPDVAFASRAPNMLQNYTSMPFNQYRQNFANEIADSVSIRIANLDNISYNVSYRYELTGTTQFYSGGNFFVAPYAENGYSPYQPFARPVVKIVFPLSSPDHVTYTVTHALNTEANLGRRQNDTIRYRQVFSNYLSYDDGTAEAGYGITPIGAQVAYKFILNQSDSLHGINMYFNQTISSANIQNFYLNVWNDYFGEPGELVYSRFGYQPEYTDDLNKFFYYELDSSIMIAPGRFPNNIFYVGWEQATDENLNLGYDKNTDASRNIFFKTFNGWSNSMLQGALMIRPVIGQERVLTIDEKIKDKQFGLYPNPASGDLVGVKTGIESSKKHEYSLLITTIDGRVVDENQLQNEIGISNLSSGFYIVHLRYKGMIVASEKLIINR